MNPILQAILIVGGLAVLAGVMLAVAAKAFKVTEDEKLELVKTMMPGANCGACGCAGCDDYASQIINNGAPINLCQPGGEDLVRKLGRLLGQDAAAIEPRTAIVACSRNPNLEEEKMHYEGRKSCVAASLFYRGKMSCPNACLGYGDCAAVCPNDAISVASGIAKVDKKRCIGCGECIKACPQETLVMRPQRAFVYVACQNPAKGKITRQQCKSGCIGCHRCEKVCPTGAIYFSGDLARIKAVKCIQCGKCIEACPTKVIYSCYQDTTVEN